jgi:uncharacterized protein YbjT (DUF2867 family)
MYAVTGITGKVGGTIAQTLLAVDGFNEGWIDFERAGEHRQGTVTLDTVIAGLIGKGEAA